MANSPQTALRPRRPEVIDEVFEGESVLVQLRTGCYFSLNESATKIWELLQDGRSAASVAASLGIELEIATGLVEQLTENELLEAAPVDAGPRANGDAALAGAPELQRFTDMQDLLMLDPIHDIDLEGDGWPVGPPAQ